MLKRREVNSIPARLRLQSLVLVIVLVSRWCCATFIFGGTVGNARLVVPAVAARASTEEEAMQQLRSTTAPSATDLTKEITHGRLDAEHLQHYFQARPWELAGRLLQVCRAAWQVYWAWSFEEGLEVSSRSRGAVLVGALESLGPAFVKVGQTLAQRADIVGEEAAQALQTLQTAARPFEDELAYDIILEDLQHQGPLAPDLCPKGCKDINARPLFASFTAAPIASASLGQVYRAITHEGVEVAVKVQRPGIADQLSKDWVSMSFCAAIYQYFVPSLNDFRVLIDAAIQGMMLEVDYHNEAHNAEEFARRHAFLGFVTVPRWLPELTGPVGRARVLTTEWIFGRRISQLPPDVGREAVQMAVQACVVQLLLTGFVHADPHEGNLLYTDDGRLAFLDFGLMDNVEPPIMEGFAKGIQGVVAGDWQRVTEAMQAVGFVSTPVQKLVDASTRPPIYKDCDFQEVVEAVAAQMKEEEGGESRFSAMASGLEKLSWRYLMLTPSYIVLITRTFMTLEGIAEKVDPGFNIYTAALPIAVRRAIAPRTREGQVALRHAVLQEGGEVRWQRLEQLLAEGGTEAEHDLGTVHWARRTSYLTEESKSSEGFDVMDGLLASSEGAALRQIFDDMNLESLVQYLASQSGQTWRRRAAAWISEKIRRPGAAPAGSRRTLKVRQRERRVIRLLLARHWRRLVRRSGILGVTASVLLLGSVAGRVLLRAGILALVSSELRLPRFQRLRTKESCGAQEDQARCDNALSEEATT
eukprot:TRINITY_DN26017_c0_g1_i1.p1 TRINITY_DN26017_c0_g1~~TRINITY_DN26017_c0_g1_i1.p1  ORF type:complete len:757 (-),score=170.69 TRINITY_DN26017_c0_g1_i1:40-2310(-)